MNDIVELNAGGFPVKNASYLKRQYESLRQQLAECQAREKGILETVDLVQSMTAFGWQQDKLKALLKMPSDATALDAMLKQAKREALLEAIAVANETAQKLRLHQPTASMYEVVLSKMAKELE